MDTPQGKILSVIDDALGRRAIVDVGAGVACPRCAAGKGCGAGLFARQNENRCLEASIPDGLQFAAGEVVEVSVLPDNVLRAALIVYGLPMFGAVATVATAYALALNDIATAAAALGGLSLGLVVARWCLSRQVCRKRFVATISRRRQNDITSA